MKYQDWSIPSFFKHSYVKNKYVFDSSPESFTENIFTDYDTPNYVRIMKKFTTPDNYPAEGDLDVKLFNDISQKSFFLRCYFPKKSIAQESKSKRIKDVVILINGLNETDRYDFYDQLGSHFAAQNIASILIPTPYHLNRHSIDKQNSDGEDGRTVKPLQMASSNPLRFFYNYKRSIYEIENLCDRILGREVDDEDLGFYDSYFARGEGVSIRITLFGFSLGGLRALGCFMKEQQSDPKLKRYHSCISFNSTADPFEADVRPFKVSPKQWEDIKEGVNNAINEDSIEASKGDNKLILRIFKWLYNRNNDKTLVEKLKKESQRFLMVQSAGDKIVDMNNDWNITDPKHGLNRIVVAGVDHIVTLDDKWHQYLPSVVKQLLVFIQNANDSSFSHGRISEEIGKIIGNTPKFVHLKENYHYKEDIEAIDFSTDFFKELISEIESDEKKKQFISLYYQSKAYFPKFPELLSRIMDKKERTKSNCQTNKDTSLRCGPGAHYEIIVPISQGQEVKILAIASSLWLHVEIKKEAGLKKIVGYISSDNINH
jgi:hypothetical protein